MFKKLGFALVACGLSVSASASPFSINPGTGSTTAPINELGYTGTLATSFYYGLTPGSTVVDTNVASVAAGMGYVSGSYTAINGTTPRTLLDLNRPPLSLSYYNIDKLNPLDAQSGDNVQGFGLPGGFGMFYNYTLNGTLTSTGVQYTSGSFDLFRYDVTSGGLADLTTATQVAKVLVTGSALQAANLNVFGVVDFNWCGGAACSSLAKNFFNDVASGKSFYDIWSSASPPPDISFVLDTNVNPPIPTPDQLVCVNPANNPGGACNVPLVRQSTLDGSATFNVPEPASLALLGIGLLGAGVSRRKKNA